MAQLADEHLNSVSIRKRDNSRAIKLPLTFIVSFAEAMKRAKLL